MITVPTILYVEDDENDRFFMMRAFNAAGIASALRAVNDGEAAIHYLAGHGHYGDRTAHPFPYLVLLDLNLPKFSGFEVLEWIRSQSACTTLLVIIFSASPCDEDKSRAKALGANDYWVKPDCGTFYREVVARLRAKWLSSPDIRALVDQPNQWLRVWK